ncbi:MAG: cohesin domain-containing protein [bacterium]|nr:cohesin domain-containing protein [bacterium]
MKYKVLSIKYKKRVILIPVFFVLYFLFSASQVNAATFYFDKDKVEAGVGDSFRVEFIMDSLENVNAVEGKINFPGNLLEVQNINDAGSVVSLWIERPAAVKDQIIFSGAIPGGYPALGGHLFSIDFKAKQVGTGLVSAGSVSALLNDGKGSSSTVIVKKLSVAIGPTAIGVSAPEIIDTILPEDFQPVIASNTNLFEGRHFLSFVTQDKGSGLDHYEILEQQSFFKPYSPDWLKTISPYLLKDQELGSWIGVRAIDNNGNIRTVWIMPHWVTVYRYVLTIIFGIIVLAVLALLVRGRK